MSDEKSNAYFKQARLEQQQYSELLLRENERLRQATVALESDKRRAEAEQNAALEELRLLRAHLSGVNEQNQRHAAQYAQIETHNSNLANLYVASYQLHSSVDRFTIVRAIEEIVINLIGSEELAIYEAVGSAGEFHLVSSFGVDTSRLGSFRLGDGFIGGRLAVGQIFVDESPAAGEKLTACIPLTVEGSIIGAILVFRLLEHKTSLQPVDHELFELLAVHASTALYCASLHEEMRQTAVAR